MRRVAWLSTYAVAMGLLEAAVVVYLRALYYPEGFHFPLVTMPEKMAGIEVVREVTTILMLGAVAALAGTDAHDRFFVFGFLFGAWDLVYYVGLFLFLGWPGSLATWDILFLIPVPWVSPVLYPILISLLLVVGFVLHEILRSRGRPIRLWLSEWLVASLGATLLLVSFCWRARAVLAGDEPHDFPVLLFATGLVVAVVPFARAGGRALRA